jgi:hypothetical protein
MNNEKLYYVYLLTNWNNKVMYIGITSDLKRRFYEHRNKLVKALRTSTTLPSLYTLKPQLMLRLPLPGRRKSRNGGEKRKID